MKNNHPPTVSIIITNWNGAQLLPKCLQAISTQTYTDYETIVVDNASSDGSADHLEEQWPGLQVIHLAENCGFAAANNRGARQARGRWLALVNNDAYPEADWLENLVAAAQSQPGYKFFASCLLQSQDPRRIDSAGDICHASGLGWNRGRNQALDLPYYESEEVFGPCAAAGMFETQAFLQADGFDELYFSHYEDIDLSFRLRLQGCRCLYVPKAKAIHIGSASFGGENDQTIYQAHRNMVWTYFKNMPGRLVWRFLPAHLLANLVFLIHYSLSGHAKAVWRAKWHALRGLPQVFRKRKKIQQSRTVGPQEIERVLDRQLLSPYILGKNAEVIKNWARRIGIHRL